MKKITIEDDTIVIEVGDSNEPGQCWHMQDENGAWHTFGPLRESDKKTTEIDGNTSQEVYWKATIIFIDDEGNEEELS